MRAVWLLSAMMLPGLAHAGTFQSFDLKGGGGTCGAAIASNGLVAGVGVAAQAVGSTLSSSSTTPAPQVFLYAAGAFSFPKIDLPAGIMSFTGVNRFRVITGFDFSGGITAAVTTNFIYHHGTITIPTTAGTLPITGLSGINDRGDILGLTQTPSTGEFSWPRTFGFLRAPDGKVTMIDDGVSSVFPRGMDARADRVVGTSFGSGLEGWSFAAGVFTPVAYPGASFTFPTGVDEAGTISGSYLVGDPAQQPPPPSHGFFLRRGTYISYAAPVKGATATIINGMNEADQITGCYTDAKGLHGFIHTP